MLRRALLFFISMTACLQGCSAPEVRELPALGAANQVVMVYSDHVRERIGERMREHENQRQNLADLMKYHAKIKADGPGWFTEDNAKVISFTRILEVMTQIQSLQVASAADLFSVARVQSEEAIRMRTQAGRCPEGENPERDYLLLLSRQYQEFAKQNIELGDAFFQKARATGAAYRSFLVQNAELSDITDGASPREDITQSITPVPVPTVPAVPIIPVPAPTPETTEPAPEITPPPQGGDSIPQPLGQQ